MAESKPDTSTTTAAKSEGDKKVKKKKKDDHSEGGHEEEETSSGSNASETKEEQDDVQEKGTEQIGQRVSTAAVVIDRDEYLQAHRELSYDRTTLQLKNNILHRRLADYYKKRKFDHVLKPLEQSADLEEKYQQKLLGYEDLKEKSEREVTDINAKVQAVELTYNERLIDAEKKFDELQAHEKTTGSGLIYSKKGKPIADKTVHRFLTLQRRKQEQQSALCLRYIRARNAVAELDSIVRKLEKLGPGLYVAQYEQLCIDNQNYNTKIEEREDELIKNRTKCTEYNQMLAHIREKMHHTDEVIDFTECDLGDAVLDYQTAREDLGQVKTRRDRLRWALEAERRKAGLLTRKDLLRDYQDASDMLVCLRERKENLEIQIEKTSQKLRVARRCMKLQHDSSQKSATSIL